MENAGNFFLQGAQNAGEVQHRSRSVQSYQILVKISGSLSGKVKAEQEYAQQRYGQSGFLGMNPELVLARFEAKEEMEETLLRWLHRIVGQQEAFNILFNNYGSMPGYPLYLRVQDPAPFRALTEGLRVIDGLLKNNDCKTMQIFHHPRLAITSQIDKRQEMEIMLDFSGRSFREEMSVEEVLLVKSASAQSGGGIVSRLMLSPTGLKRTESNSPTN